MQSTVYVQSSTCENKIVQHSPSTSILIVSLIQQLCYIYEKDKERRNNLYTGNLTMNYFSKYIIITVHKNI